MAWLLEPKYLKNPRYRALIIRRNADDLSDWVDRAREMYRDTGATFAYRPVIITFPSGAIFRTGHLKDENAYGKYIGHEYHKMLIEELTQIPTEDRYLKLLSSCRTTVQELRPQIFATTNPGDIGHAWVKQRFVDIGTSGKPYIDPETGRARIFIPAKVKDNPTLMETNPEYLRFLDGLPDQLRRAWRDGDWDIIAGQVFTEWLRKTHVVEPFKVPKEWSKWISIDWGVNNPSAVGWYTQSYDGRTYLYRELYMDGTDFLKTFGKPMTPARLARVILKITKKAEEEYLYCVADPSMWNKVMSGGAVLRGRAIDVEGMSIAETMANCHQDDKELNEGLKMMKGDNDRFNGLARYREALSIAPDGKPWYQVFSSCVDTIRTIPALPYDLSKVEDVDTGAEDHCFDRDKYFFMSRPVKPERKMAEKKSPLARMYALQTGKLKEDYQYDQYEREWLTS